MASIQDDTIKEDIEDKEEFAREAVFDYLKKSGLRVAKIGRSGPMNRTRIKLSPDGTDLIWYSKRKSRRQSRVPLEAVSRVTIGQGSRNFARLNASYFYKHADKDEDNNLRSISLIWDAGKESFDIIIKKDKVLNAIMKHYQKNGIVTEEDATDTNTVNLIINAIIWQVEYLSQLARREPVQTRFIRELFEEADKNNSGTVDLAEALAISAKLNLGKSDQVIEEAVKSEASEDGTLTLLAFTSVMLELIGNHDSHSLWAALCCQLLTTDTAAMPGAAFHHGLRPMADRLAEFLRGAERNIVADFEELVVPTNQFAKFLLEVQKETNEDTIRLLTKYKLKLPKKLASLEKKTKKKKVETSSFYKTNIEIDLFSEFIDDVENSLVSPTAETTVYHDMTRPLNQYWIASSHNSYLTGDQLMSASSVDRYIDDLMEGCRCVELDCWDNADGEPCIYHGNTMTSKISFKAVIQAVADYGFKTSPYPIILSLENHCSPPFQQKMAQYLKKILHSKGLLWLPPDSSLQPNPTTEPITALPSPEEAKYKVIVKGKVGRFASDDENEKDENVPKVTSAALYDGEDSSLGSSDSEDDDSVIDIGHSGDKIGDKDELDDLIAIKGRKMKHLHESVDSPEAEMIHSLKEAKIEKVAKKQPHLLLKLLESKLIRTYPGNLRIDSSNYDPVMCWNYGCQIVALNYQTSDAIE